MSISLLEIMNEMAAGDVRPRPYLPADRAVQLAPKPKQQNMTELQAFVSLDPLLADLHKQFLDAKAQYERLVSENGKGDAMATR